MLVRMALILSMAALYVNLHKPGSRPCWTHSSLTKCNCLRCVLHSLLAHPELFTLAPSVLQSLHYPIVQRFLTRHPGQLKSLLLWQWSAGLPAGTKVLLRASSCLYLLCFSSMMVLERCVSLTQLGTPTNGTAGHSSMRMPCAVTCERHDQASV
jgi:hypothetical protein